MRNILILGAGELGTAIATALINHTSFDSFKISLTFAIRPDTLAALEHKDKNSEPSRHVQTLLPFHNRGVLFTKIDLIIDSESTLATLFARYNTIIHAGAMTLPPGTQLKVTRAALAAKVVEYIPWQWGVDYDKIGPTGGLGLFAEQCEVRDLLRSQFTTKWFIVSCGVFMSFLFEDFWGVVVRNEAGQITGVRALGGWDHLVTATTVEDIARCNAELVLVDREVRGGPVYIAGDTMTYKEFAYVASRVVGRDLTMEEWKTDYLMKESSMDEVDKLRKYRVVFSEDRGLAWKKEATFNSQKGIAMEGIEAYMKRMEMC